MNNEIENDETDPIYQIDPIEEIGDCFAVAAATAIDAGMSFDDLFALFVGAWETAERSAEIEKQVEKEWNAKPEAERKQIEANLLRILTGENE
jgi:hypothetical protein